MKKLSMKVTATFPTNKRQPDPKPPLQPPPPSLALYLSLLGVSIVLIFIAFTLDKPDWPGLLINLASGLIGTVIILIFVDQRLRANEVEAMTNFGLSLGVFFQSIYSLEIRQKVLYSRNFNKQLRRIRPKSYYFRSNVESIFDSNAGGFILYGEPGLGKSTLLQSIALTQTEKAMIYPRRSRVPVIYPMFRWSKGDLFEQIWREIYQYHRIKKQTFKKWLEIGELLLIFDGLNESMDVKSALDDLSAFKSEYPKTVFLVSTRPYLPKSVNFDKLRLPKIQMPPLTQEELTDFLTKSRGE